MRAVDIILKKRNGKELTKEEIDFLIEGYTAGNIPDYQVSSFLMSVYFKGMTEEETAHLTNAMVQSGDQIDLSKIEGIKVDKHSTGGVGDKTSLIIGPLVASVGIPVAKMSGRGLGHTGGTVDKLEAIEGFQVELTTQQFIDNVNEHKIAIVGQSGNLTPADKKLYALRDVTGTVDSIPLIASSIMSKKIASGSNAIVLDVKFGSGAFMKTLDDARKLANAMVGIGNKLGRQTIAIITDMGQPLGHEIGNANEVKEAIDVLSGKGDHDLTEVCLTLAGNMAVLGGAYDTFEEAYAGLTDVLKSGKAVEKMRDFVVSQGGNGNQITSPETLPQAAYHIEIKAEAEGNVEAIDAESVGIAAMLLGAGRKTKEDAIDYAVGITLLKKVGDTVAKGDTLAIFHANAEDIAVAEKTLKDAYTFTDKEVPAPELIHDIIK
ncbi:pyrimidine-nucleoside phosphorylase [Fictibacillus macauensis ZFHKF-1]|uniref:Pyrimidine-nucleoside phosphorylase n=1 Tax=Fictibacillus macauensis ZFHKF-1 TaxID=1196324 RepID=I8UK60_9BACL|nr:pyrimidine-nucleoside phosphorylase [Fictibacillus macauensis]EIT87270.1 pyrimidine-nucleoside phosphorylase [Fictibacillus macauensis ZFHKF-1]